VPAVGVAGPFDCADAERVAQREPFGLGVTVGFAVRFAELVPEREPGADRRLTRPGSKRCWDFVIDAPGDCYSALVARSGEWLCAG
jgi:hypothetical protein